MKKVLVSSTVYGNEELLELIYSKLASLGFEVWMSYKGTMPVSSAKTAFQNCLDAVAACDYFLGIINPHYGSGVDPNDPEGISITHQEFREAIRLKKPRWILVHEHVVFLRDWINALGFKQAGGRNDFCSRLAVSDVNHERARKKFDLRAIDLYEEVIQDFERARQVPLEARIGNWAQPFMLAKDAEVFVMAQFSRYQEAESFIDENMKRGGVK